MPREDLYAPKMLGRALISDPKLTATKEFNVDCNRRDNYTPNGSLNKPFKSINAAIAMASGSLDEQTGVLITLAPGHYHEDVVINRSLSIRGADQSTTIVDSIEALGTMVTVDYVTISDITLMYFGGESIQHLEAHRVRSSGVGFSICTNVFLDSCYFDDDCLVVNSQVHIRNCQHTYGMFLGVASALVDWPEGVTDTEIILQNCYFIGEADHTGIAADPHFLLIRFICCYSAKALLIGSDITFENCCSVFTGGIDTITGTYTNYAGYPEEPET